MSLAINFLLAFVFFVFYYFGMERRKLKSQFRKVYSITDGITFDSVQDAADYYNVDQSHVSKVCQGHRKHTGGIKFCYDENVKNLNSPEKNER